MSDEKEIKKADGAETATEESSAKSPLMKYIIFGAGGLVLILVIAFGTAFFLKGDPPVQADVSHEIVAAEAKTEAGTPAGEAAETDVHREPSAQPEHGQQAATKDHATESENVPEPQEEEIDYSAIEKIMDNLAFLDYEPEPSETEMADNSISDEDSVEAVNWIEEKKAALDEREKGLDAREKKLNRLEQEVNQKLLTIEQAESVRIGKLAKLYDGMDPRSVVQLMANLDDKTVVDLLPKMKIKNASQVLSMMPSKRAAKLSKQMITIAGN